MSLGLNQQYNLSKILCILYPSAAKNHTDWAPIPCTLSGFRSRVLNVLNKNASSLIPLTSDQEKIP